MSLAKRRHAHLHIQIPNQMDPCMFENCDTSWYEKDSKPSGLNTAMEELKISTSIWNDKDEKGSTLHEVIEEFKKKTTKVSFSPNTEIPELDTKPRYRSNSPYPIMKKKISPRSK